MALTDIRGLSVGQAHYAGVRTGVTVVLCDRPMACAVDVRGGAPGTRETEALRPDTLVEGVDAITLSGGSVYGLAAADAVTRRLGAMGRGYRVVDGIPPSPIVPGAILFDNANGGDKAWGDAPPFADLALAALASAAREIAEGAVGAGCGAGAGTHAGGIGTASERVGVHTVSALIAANPVGSPYMPGTSIPWAWPWEVDGEFGGARPGPDWALSRATDTKLPVLDRVGAATVIGVVATDAALSVGQLQRLAVCAQDGIAMAVQPAHTPLDGDTIFALSNGSRDLEEPTARALAWLGAAAARVTARALMRGVWRARP